MRINMFSLCNWETGRLLCTEFLYWHPCDIIDTLLGERLQRIFGSPGRSCIDTRVVRNTWTLVSLTSDCPFIGLRLSFHWPQIVLWTPSLITPGTSLLPSKCLAMTRACWSRLEWSQWVWSACPLVASLISFSAVRFGIQYSPIYSRV